MHRKKPLQPRKVFLAHLLRNIVLSFLFILISLSFGMWGYHHFEKMAWIDAFVNAAMILSGMGPAESLHTFKGKLFAGFYALYSGLALIIALGVLFSPIMRRFFHKLDLDTEEVVEDPNPCDAHKNNLQVNPQKPR